MKAVLFGMVFVSIVFTEFAMANLFEIKKDIEKALCQKLAASYANDPSAFSVASIAQLQICLAQTLKNTSSTITSKNFNIQPPRPSTNIVDSSLPTPPTPPTAPQSIKIR